MKKTISKKTTKPKKSKKSKKQKDAFDNIIKMLDDYYEGTPQMETKYWTNGE